MIVTCYKLGFTTILIPVSRSFRYEMTLGTQNGGLIFRFTPLSQSIQSIPQCFASFFRHWYLNMQSISEIEIRIRVSNKEEIIPTSAHSAHSALPDPVSDSAGSSNFELLSVNCLPMPRLLSSSNHRIKMTSSPDGLYLITLQDLQWPVSWGNQLTYNR